MMDAVDRQIVNRLQRAFPITERPYAEAAAELGIEESELIERLQRLLDDGTLTRFGPLYQAERLGGGLCLCAMEVPEGEFERVTEQVNAHPEVAHNYAREHRLNMWFVLATARPEQIGETVRAIEEETGYPVLALPKEKEYFVGLHFEV